jgi:hypothetical protein
MLNQNEPFYFAPQPRLGGGWICFKSSPSPPPAPDYTGAAIAQSNSQKDSQYTPYGNQIYSTDASSPSGYKSTVSLAPEAQKTLDTQMALSNQMGDLTQKQIGNVNDTYSKPLDLSSVQGVADKAYGAMTSRLDPQWQHQQQTTETQLANQGLRAGDEGYTNAMRDFNNAKNDAYQQANLGAISTMPQTYQLANAEYQQPLNQLNAIRTGAQIQNPTFTPAGAGTNYLGAAQAQGQYGQNLYNQQVGSNNAMTSGLFSALGTIGGGMFGGPMGGTIGGGIGRAIGGY